MQGVTHEQAFLLSYAAVLRAFLELRKGENWTNADGTRLGTVQWLSDESGVPIATTHRVLTGTRKVNMYQAECMVRALGVKHALVLDLVDATTRDAEEFSKTTDLSNKAVRKAVFTMLASKNVHQPREEGA
tara:strand:- start:2465 stop:2857 length:393 start_codon:yes stop_codon:yes gene_type:complete